MYSERRQQRDGRKYMSEMSIDYMCIINGFIGGKASMSVWCVCVDVCVLGEGGG